jgi:hypothetical protein
MDEFYGIPPEQIDRLRALARDKFGGLLLTEALRRIKSMGGEATVEDFRAAMVEKIERTETDDAPEFELVKRLAVEDLYRASQQAFGEVPQPSRRDSAPS